MVSPEIDVAIVGGGIAGLWLANLLADRGYSLILLEAGRLGQGQTLASQGMIHGGLKYALSGTLTGAAQAIAGMPDRWAACLQGTGDLDLSALKPLSRDYYMFAGDSTLGRLTTFFASRALRSRIERLRRHDFPPVLADPGFNGVVYRLNDFVIDCVELIGLLHRPIADRAYEIELTEHSVSRSGDAIALQLGDTGLRARTLVLAAGAGTQALLDVLDIDEPTMQLRPLHQVVVRGPALRPLYAHCLTGIRRAEPRLTITSHPDDAGWLWYLGGQLATDGVTLKREALVDHARAELRTCLPWMDWEQVTLTTLRVDRAEPAQGDGNRPDEAFAAAVGPCVIAWPTKLSLTPDLGDRVLALLPPPRGGDLPPIDLPPARPGHPPWHR